MRFKQIEADKAPSKLEKISSASVATEDEDFTESSQEQGSCNSCNSCNSMCGERSMTSAAAFKTLAVRKQVTVDETRNVATRSAANAKFAGACWYTPQELKFMQKSAVSQIQELVLSPSEAEKSYRRVLQRVYEACCSPDPRQLNNSKTSILSAKDSTDLTRIVVKSNTRSGLEKAVVKHLSGSLRKQLVQTCLEVQSTMKGIPGTMRSTAIQQSLEPLSQPARLLAQELGRAQAQYKKHIHDKPLKFPTASSSQLLCI